LIGAAANHRLNGMWRIMAKIYSEELRAQVLEFLAAGGRPVEAIRRFGVKRAIVYVWRKQAKAGRKKPLPKGRKRRNDVVDAAELTDYVEAHPRLNTAEIGEYFGVDGATIRARLRQVDYTSKGGLRPSFLVEERVAKIR